MANTSKTMLQIRRILQLLDQGSSSGKIAKELSISLNTVKKYIQNFHASGLSNKLLLEMDDSSLQLIVYPQKVISSQSDRRKQLSFLLPDFVKRLHNTHATRELLWAEYKKSFPKGYSYSQFCDHLHNYLLRYKAVLHLEHKPGETLQIDFAGDKLSYVNKLTGEIIQCPVLVCTMPYSNLTYIEALSDQTQINLIGALNRCLFYLGGVPCSIKSDNLKQVVNKPNRYEPQFSEVIDQFAIHYNVSFTAARVVKPRDKASVERHVGISYQQIYSVLEQKTFYSLQELNAGIGELLITLNNTPMQRKDHSRSQLFEQMEKPFLNQLPENPFEVKHQAMAKVMRNYHVILGEDWHNYSVPYQYIGKHVMLIYDLETVEIYHSMVRIAVHVRNQRKHGYSTQEHHMPSNHKAAVLAKGYTPEYFLNQAQKIGVNIHQVIIKIIEQRQFSEQTYNSCLGILRLKEKYGASRLESACLIALDGKMINYRNIHNILQNNRDQLPAPQTGNAITQRNHSNIRGKDSYRGLFDQIQN